MNLGNAKRRAFLFAGIVAFTSMRVHSFAARALDVPDVDVPHRNYSSVSHI
jgi:hypothetical protein